MRPLDVAEMLAIPTAASPAEKDMGTGGGSDAAFAFDALSRREWLSVNGLGSFAMGSVSGAPTRRYHALLSAALAPPLQRMTILGKLEEMLTIQGERFDLSTNRYPHETVYPDGWRYVATFAPWPVPTWHYNLPGESVLVKRIFLARGKNTVYVTYTLREAPAMATLTLTPLVCWKKYHDEMRPWSGFPARLGPEVGGWFVQATRDSPRLHLRARGAGWTPAGWWHEGIQHDRERERGMDFSEDLYCPAVATLTLRVGQTVSFVATIEPDEPDDFTLALAEIVRRQEGVCGTATGLSLREAEQGEAFRDLVLASDTFVIAEPNVRATILAGYPWFTDWGRDTMIALPGLCLTTGRHTVAAEILRSYAHYVSEGMIPNRFPDQGETPDYNTVDATLWFIHACSRYVEATGDEAFKSELLPVLQQIIEAHLTGTRYNIGVDPADGLLHAGQAGVQLTWMDAKVGDWVVTPRDGKPVEINALWLYALRVAADWSGENGSGPLSERAAKTAESFRTAFIRSDGRGLYDVIRPDGTPDASVRPNQVIAAALETTPLTDDEVKAVLTVATEELLTPFGLRSLSPQDSAYKGQYAGNLSLRDGAYHQGTVWAWLIGSFVDLYRRVHGPDASVDALVAPLIARMREFGVGGVSEVADGDAPHAPDGCPYQAWSVAELLRVMAATPAAAIE